MKPSASTSILGWGTAPRNMHDHKARRHSTRSKHWARQTISKFNKSVRIYVARPVKSIPHC